MNIAPIENKKSKNEGGESQRKEIYLVSVKVKVIKVSLSENNHSRKKFQQLKRRKVDGEIN